MTSHHCRPILAGLLLLLAAGCRLEQRPPAGPAREQAALQGAVAGYYDALAHHAGSLPRDTALDGDSLVLVRTDAQFQRDLASAWATLRLYRTGADGIGTRLQLLFLRRTGGSWSVQSVSTAAP